MIPQEAIKQRRSDRKSQKQKHTEKCEKCEGRMNENQMPEWAKVLYHQNKAIMAELGIDS